MSALLNAPALSWWSMVDPARSGPYHFSHNLLTCLPTGCISGGGPKGFAKRAAERRLCRFWRLRLRTRIYVDGLSLFHGLLSKSPYKWLDLVALFELVLAEPARVDHVNYYTARIKASSADDPGAAVRQQRYLRALVEYRADSLTIREGFMQRNWKWLRLRRPRPGIDANTAEVAVFCEKQTDVNLATDLIADAWRGRFDQAVICSHDSDLEAAIAAVKRDLPHLLLGLVAPIPSHVAINRRLTAWVDWHKTLSPAHLQAAQLPSRIRELHRPAEW